MKPPSDELTAMSDASKPNPEQTIRVWALLLGKLQIICGAFIYDVTEEFVNRIDKGRLGWMLLSDMEKIKDGSIFEIMLINQSQQLTSGENIDDPIWVYFMRGDQAVIEYCGKEQLDPVTTPFIGFRGTWEEVARKLFELEKLMLEKASVPEAPKDL